MEPPFTRLKEARQRAGFGDATAAARHFGWTVPTYLAHENGSRSFGVERAVEYGRAFKVSASWLLIGEGGPPEMKLRITGYIGAGGVIYLAEEDGKFRVVEEVDIPASEFRDYAAFKVRGDTLYPAYRDGEIIFARKDGGPPRDHIDRECIVRTEDGKTYLKTLLAGSSEDRFTLISHNAPPMPDQRVVWAAPVEWARRAWQRWPTPAPAA
jgi:phage repressor protein C with HTH and peptisase S24 domain